MAIFDMDPSCAPVQRTVVAGAQVVAFTDAAPVQLIAPAGANLAEISVEGGAARFTTSGLVPDVGQWIGHRVADGARIELESLAELNNFQLIGAPGQTGSLYVEYFMLPTSGNG